MKRIKSAPADLALMANRKKNNLEISDKRNTPVIMSLGDDFDILDEIDNEKLLTDNVNVNLKYFKNFRIIKTIKNYVNKFSQLTSDLISDSNLLSLEESTIYSALIIYISENITRKDKLKEAYGFLIQYITKYLILLFIHTQILHDKILDLPAPMKDVLSGIIIIQ